MIARLLTLVAWLAISTAPAHAAPADEQPRKPRVAIVSIELAAVPNLAQGAARDVAPRMQVDLYGLGGGLLPSVEKADLAAYDLVLLEGVGPQLLNFNDQIEAAKARTKVVVVNGERWIKGNVDPASLPDLQTYWTNGTRENYVRLLDYLAVRVLGRAGAPAPPVVYPVSAFYHPAAEQPFANLAGYLAWESARLPDAAARPRIGLLFYRSLVLAKNAKVIDALIAEIERQGGLPIPLWRKDSAESFSLLTQGGAPAPGAVILCSNWIDYQDHAAGAAAAKALNSAVLNCTSDYSRTPQEWEAAIGGFAPSRSSQLAMGELEGLAEPMMVGARALDETGAAVNTPLEHQVRWRVARALRWARLKSLANAEKRIVIPYYSEARNTADVGSDPDSYLDAQSSLIALLNRMKAEGYDLGPSPLPDKAGLSALLRDKGSNPKTQGQIDARVRDGSVALVPEAVYRRWWDTLPASTRESQQTQWGPPPGDLMVHTAPDGTRSLVIPLITFGKVALAPHPIWGMQEDRGLAAKGALTPHHQYAAFYLWARQVWKADAYLPLFTQLSLMPGKQEGPSSTDWIGLLIGDLPHIQPTPLQANGGVANKRRANAVLIGFMPELVRAGLAPDLGVLKRDLNQGDADPAVQAGVRRQAKSLGLARALDLDPATAPWSALAPALRAYLDEIARAPMPHGGHTLGVAPDEVVVAKMTQAMAGDGADAPSLETIQALLRGDATPLAAQHAAQLIDYAARIRAAPRELDAVMAALSGRFVEPGPNADAIRNPDALPGGRNPYTLDTRALPSPQAWASGVKLADDMIAAYRAKHGAPPRKAAFVLWSGETVQNGGVLEAQILRLLGAHPVWNAKGQVVDVVLDDRVALGRGRVDVLVTTSGTYRDHFGDKLALLDKAVALAAASPEPDNAVRAAALATEADLAEKGVAPETAKARALRRIFSTAPGAYSPVTEFAVQADPRWSDEKLAGLYASRLAHAYGQADEGQSDGEAFSANLKTVDAAVFSRSSNAYGLLDTPMPAAYLGGLNMAVRQETGRRIETYVAQLQSPGKATLEPADKTLNRELRSRYFNPAWIKAMKAGGYNGARYMSEFTANMLLWDVSTPDLIQDRDWNEVADVYVRDRYKLGLKSYFDRENPQARRNLLKTLLEAADRGRWNADAATLSQLRAELDGGPSLTPRNSRAAAPARATAVSGGATALKGPSLRGFEMQTIVRSEPSTAASRPPPSSAWWLFSAIASMLVVVGLAVGPRSRAMADGLRPQSPDQRA